MKSFSLYEAENISIINIKNGAEIQQKTIYIIFTLLRFFFPTIILKTKKN
jgi:hypothetical protein